MWKPKESTSWRAWNRTRFTVYLLRDPDTGAAKYVGVTSNPELRKNLHMRAQTPNCPTAMAWELSLKEQGKRCIFEILEEFELQPSATLTHEVYAAETYWIHVLFLQGHPLLNRKFPGCRTYKQFFTD